MDNKDKVIIFDTTLRDGEQCPGASLNMREKLQIARQLETFGVDVIEAGFPVSSEEDFESVKSVSKIIKNASVCGLARCKDIDIERAAAALECAVKPRIHVFLATSKIHREKKLQLSKEQIIELAVAKVKKARGYVEDVEFSPEDASRTERGFLVEILTEVIKAGATTLNIPDTVGYTVPEEYGDLIAHLKANVPGADNVVFSVHCHNDLGLAVANSLSALKHGARQVECTVNGIGERAGNAAVEELVMALRTRSDFYNTLRADVNYKEIMRTSRLVRHLTGMVVQPNKAIVGDNAFAHESGIHQDGILKARETYEIMRAQDIGLEKNSLVLGKHSGRHAFGKKLSELGYDLDNDELAKAFTKFKALADKKKTVYDDDLVLIVEEEFSALDEVYTLDHLMVSSSSDKTVATATVSLKRGNEILRDAACESGGPVDAVCKTIDRITGLSGVLCEYLIEAATPGKDAQGEVSLKVDFDGVVSSGRGASTDIIEASAKAYLNAINRYLLLKKRSDG